MLKEVFRDEIPRGETDLQVESLDPCAMFGDGLQDKFCPRVVECHGLEDRVCSYFQEGRGGSSEEFLDTFYLVPLIVDDTTPEKGVTCDNCMPSFTNEGNLQKIAKAIARVLERLVTGIQEEDMAQNLVRYFEKKSHIP